MNEDDDALLRGGGDDDDDDELEEEGGVEGEDYQEQLHPPLHDDDALENGDDDDANTMDDNHLGDDDAAENDQEFENEQEDVEEEIPHEEFVQEVEEEQQEEVKQTDLHESPPLEEDENVTPKRTTPSPPPNPPEGWSEEEEEQEEEEGNLDDRPVKPYVTPTLPTDDDERLKRYFSLHRNFRDEDGTVVNLLVMSVPSPTSASPPISFEEVLDAALEAIRRLACSMRGRYSLLVSCNRHALESLVPNRETVWRLKEAVDDFVVRELLNPESASSAVNTLKRITILRPTPHVFSLFWLLKPSIPHEFWSRIAYISRVESLPREYLDSPAVTTQLANLPNTPRPSVASISSSDMSSSAHVSLSSSSSSIASTYPPTFRNYWHLHNPFQTPLTSLSSKSPFELPSVVVRCVYFLCRHGIRVRGLFRVPGNADDVDDAKRHLTSNTDVDLGGVWSASGRKATAEDVHVAAALMKMFFRELPTPILSHAAYTSVIRESANDASGLGDYANLADKLRKVFELLPEPNRALLQYLCFFNNYVVRHERDNQMSANNISIVWAPNIIRDSSGAAENELKILPIALKAMHVMIVCCDRVFPITPGSRLPPCVDQLTGEPLPVEEVTVNDVNSPGGGGSANLPMSVREFDGIALVSNGGNGSSNGSSTPQQLDTSIASTTSSLNSGGKNSLASPRTVVISDVAAIQKMSVREMKTYLRESGWDPSLCNEKPALREMTARCFAEEEERRRKASLQRVRDGVHEAEGGPVTGSALKMWKKQASLASLMLSEEDVARLNGNLALSGRKARGTGGAGGAGARGFEKTTLQINPRDLAKSSEDLNVKYDTKRQTRAESNTSNATTGSSASRAQNHLNGTANSKHPPQHPGPARDLNTESIADLKDIPLFGDVALATAAKQALAAYEQRELQRHGGWRMQDVDTMSVTELKKLIAFHKQDSSQCMGVAAHKRLAKMCLETDFDPEDPNGPVRKLVLDDGDTSSSTYGGREGGSLSPKTTVTSPLGSGVSSLQGGGIGMRSSVALGRAGMLSPRFERQDSTASSSSKNSGKSSV